MSGFVAPKGRYLPPVLFNPYTGAAREVRDIRDDPHGAHIVPPGADFRIPSDQARRPASSFQQRVGPWVQACQPDEASAASAEHLHRLFEEAIELMKTGGTTREEAHRLVERAFDRPAGEPSQAVGGVLLALAAFCVASGLDMEIAGEIELARVWAMVETIRARQALEPAPAQPPAEAAAAPTSPMRRQATPDEAVDAVLEEAYWIPALDAQEWQVRLQDDAHRDAQADHRLSVSISPDGDAWISAGSPDRPLRFRTWVGGGKSLRVRNAIMVLAEAIRRDNRQTP